MRETESAGGIVLNKQSRVLVVSQHGTAWSLPKGHVEEGETKLDAAKREIKEEAGIEEVEYLKQLGSYQRYKLGRDAKEDRSERKTIFMFLFKADQDKLKPIDPENPEARWVPKDEVSQLLTAKEDKAFYLSVLDKI